MSDEQQGAPAPAPAPTTTQATPPTVEATVPYSRFSEVIRERNAYQEKAAQAASLASALQEAQAKAASLEAQFSTFRTVASTLGQTDPEAVELTQWAYSRLPQEGRPELATWLQGVKADPAAAPLAIRHLLPQAANQAPAPAPGAPAPVPTQVTSPRAAPSAVAGAPAATPPVSDADVARVRAQCQRTGDWTPWKELRKSIG